LKPSDNPGFPNAGRDAREATRNRASDIARELIGRETSLDPETVRSNRTMQHVGAVMSGLPETPTHGEDGTLELPSTEDLAAGDATDRSTARDRIAQQLIRAGKLKPTNYDRSLTDFAAELQRERGLNEDNPGDSGSILSKEQIVRALTEAVMQRRREG